MSRPRSARSRSAQSVTEESSAQSGSRLTAVAGIGLAVVALGFILIVATLNRGFDWSDESFVYTMIASNRVAEGEVWGFQHILNPLYEAFGESVLAFRVLRLVGYVLLSGLIVLAARSLALRLGLVLSRLEWVLVALFAQVGTFAAWSYPPRYLGYNEVASWLAQAGCVVLLMLLADAATARDSRRNQWATAALWASVGLIVVLLTFIKVSSGAIFGLLAFAAVVVPIAGFAWWKRILGAAAGAGLSVLGLWFAGYPVVSYLSSVLATAFDRSAQEASDHSLSEIAMTYLGSLGHTVAALMVPMTLFAVVAWLLVRRGGGSESSERVGLTRRVGWTLGVLLVLAMCFIQADGTWNIIGATVALMGAAGAIIFIIIGSTLFPTYLPTRSARAAVWVGAALIAVTPFVSAVGTNNPIFGQTLFSATLWAVFLAVALAALRRMIPARVRLRPIPLVLGGTLLAIFVSFVVGDVFIHPYRTVPYFQQNSATTAPPLRGILMTEEEARLSTWLNEVALSESAQDVPATAIAAPGALFSFNQSGWANPWVDQMWPVSFTSVELACGGTPPKDLFVLQPQSETVESPSYQGFVEAMWTCGVDFPQDFEVVAESPGEIPTRAMTVWRLAAGE